MPTGSTRASSTQAAIGSSDGQRDADQQPQCAPGPHRIHGPRARPLAFSGQAGPPPRDRQSPDRSAARNAAASSRPARTRSRSARSSTGRSAPPSRAAAPTRTAPPTPRTAIPARTSAETPRDNTRAAHRALAVRSRPCRASSSRSRSAKNSPPLATPIAINHGSTTASISGTPQAGRNCRSHAARRSATTSSSTVPSTTSRMIGPFSISPTPSASHSKAAQRRDASRPAATR